MQGHNFSQPGEEKTKLPRIIRGFRDWQAVSLLIRSVRVRESKPIQI